MSTSNWIILMGMIIVGVMFILASQNVMFGWMSMTEEDAQKAEAEELVSLIQRISSEASQKFYYCKSLRPVNITIKESIFTFERGKFKFSYTVPKSTSEAELIDATRICMFKENDKIKISENVSLNFCPRESLCPGAPEAFKDSLENDCCPFDVPVCTSKHCCPEDEPRWCAKPKDGGEPKCMSKEDYNKECVRKTYTILFIQLNGQISNLEAKAEDSKNHWIRITPLSNCPDNIEAIAVTDKVCNANICDALDGLMSCAISWGYGSVYTRIVGVAPGQYVCQSGIGGYTMYGATAVVTSDYYIGFVSTHEMGHTFGLCDEGYGSGPCSGVSCPSGWCTPGGGSGCYGGGMCCPNKPETNSIMCSKDMCSSGCTFSSERFAPSSYAHLEKELNKYCE
jgi:hypothetical protein